MLIAIITPSPNTNNLNTTTPSSRLNLASVRPRTIIFKLHNHCELICIFRVFQVSCFPCLSDSEGLGLNAYSNNYT